MSDGERRQQEAARAQMVAFWRRYDAMEARLTRPVSERMLDLAGVGPGMRVLDVASGRGEPALPAAHRVGPRGHVLATDLSDGLLQMARERATQEGLSNITFEMADAQALDVGERSFDVATVRWALMFMPEPERALENLHRALVPGGALVVASWAEPDRVAWATLHRRVLARFRKVDLPPLDGPGPGVSRHGNPAVLEDALRRQGFTPEAHEELEVPIVEGRDGRDILDWFRTMGGPVMKLVDELPEHAQRAWEDALVAELEKSRVGDRVTLGGVTRLTLARASGR